MFYTNFALEVPKAPLFRRRLVEATIYGKKFTKPFGPKFAPIRHNWVYSIEPHQMRNMINQKGLVTVLNTFDGIVRLSTSKTYAPSNDPQVIQTRFVDDWLPALDKGLETFSIRGTGLFLSEFLVLGYHLGFDTTFLTYVLIQIANTEAFSYIHDRGFNTEISGNSIFGYSNHAMIWLLVYKFGWKKSSWLLLIAASYGLFDFGVQFIVPSVSKVAHFWGLFVGLLCSYLY